MPRPADRSVSDALFGPLPEAERRRIYGDGGGRSASPATQTGQDGPDVAGKGRPGKENLPSPRENAPESPWGLRPREWWGVLKDTVAEIGQDRVTSVAGGVTFFGLLALFPAITALVSIFGLVADPTLIESQLEKLGGFIPPSALDIISGQVEAIVKAPGAALSFAGIAGLLATLWSANGGMKALMDALNVAQFQRESRGFIKLNIVSLLLTLGAMVLLILLIAAIAVLPAVLAWLPLPESTKDMLTSIRWPIMFAVLLLAISALYRWGPSRHDAHFSWISPGALLAAIGLVGTSALFSWYAGNFANYNETYGTLGAAVVLMMWLWISAIVVMVGAELNGVLESHLRALSGQAQKPE
ncbi:YihY/virulence factor BrkB family protein [Paracoccus aurantiacus]|uniref:YihY/virulence factor BrkB family protein n=1 Tax=Paracoccus aurantiacus TaxID=2599412 RepID=A0A5C6RZ16_9RHOB|nr:YihY/virulence factor BrkB family protein [Paracoccus aurantiacus]TXB67521.1 YihY/virulence factor BrkB family protein [Paracoccus aurantiacus]